MAALTGAALLAGCASAVPIPIGAPPGPITQQPVTQAPPPTRPAPPPISTTIRQPPVLAGPGFEDVTGAHAAALIRMFGQPQLDVREGDVRKLQFSGEACVLDVFLYLIRERSEPEATWFEARRKSDGLEVDRAKCIAALRR
jgi:FtsP/CotA-like multicopper oxidase with cupredoxin domain